MSWNGSGIYTLPPLYSPEVNGTVIDATRYNGLTTDIATGINNCLTKDGQNIPTANIPMGGFKLTGMGGGASTGQAITWGQTGLASVAGNFRAGNTSLTGLRFIADSDGSAVAPASYRTGTVGAFLRSSTVNTNAGLAIVSGNAVNAFLSLGDHDADTQGGIEYNNSTETLGLRANGANRVTLTDSQMTGSGITAKFTTVESSSVSAFSSLSNAGVFVYSNTGQFGYGSGAGGGVTQITSKSTPVTINRPTGRITTHNASLAAGAFVTFTVNNSLVTENHIPVIVMQSPGAANTYECFVSEVNLGSFNIQIRNASASPQSTALVFRFSLFLSSEV